MGTLTPQEISRLSVAERLSLIGDLWDSLEDSALSLSDAQSAELDHRLETFDGDLKDAVTWEELKADLATRTA